MDSIKHQVQREEDSSPKTSYQMTNLKSILRKKVDKRKKTINYQKSKKFLESAYLIKEKNASWPELYHSLNQVNTFNDINHHEPILSSRNKLIRWLALKIRNIIQSEIRFTLDPIIKKQEHNNAHSIQTINQIVYFLKNFEKQISENHQKVNENSSELSNQKDIMKKIQQGFLPELWKYVDFENRFRGSEKDIRENQSNYIHYIKEAEKNTNGTFVLDVGCGRGEFLKILDDHNISSLGIDTNPEMVKLNQDRNIKVENSDANSFLEKQTDNILIGIVAFQVIEHFSPTYLLNFIKTSYEKLQQGGVIILETVNPMSFFSFSHFWYDLSHIKPIPSDILNFYLESAGFKDVKTIFSSPPPKELQLKGDDENTKKLNEILFGPQDYSVIGWKK